MSKSILLCAAILCAFHSTAQFKLSGIVIDSVTGEPLPGASVQLVNAKLVTIADNAGVFEFNNIGAGSKKLKVTFVGYRDGIKQITVRADQQLTMLMSPVSIITEAVVVRATRADNKTPTTFTNVSREEIQRQNFAQDVPFLLNWTPSVVTTSDAGTGIGYTGIRIRGSDPTRINVTINGIPYNDSESAGTFWVDIPDIASSSESIQVQRGVGTSTNGAGAFGATINLQTNVRREDAYGELTNSFGSFNTRRHTLSFGTGTLGKNFNIDGRLSRIASDGYIDRAFSDLSSYYFSAGYYGERTFLKAIMFGGKERTYQSWYGVPESRLNNDTEAMLITAMNEGWNEAQIENLLSSDSRTFNPYIYEDQVDDYQQDHYQLHFSTKVSPAITFNTALHYTPGKGYYEEYRFEDDFASYGLPDEIIDDDGVTDDNDTIRTTDLIRRRWLDNHFYGLTWSANIDKLDWNIIFGGGWNKYDGDHYGEIMWTKLGSAPYPYRYYDNTGVKKDFNTFVKANFQVSENLNAFGDLQYRRLDYLIEGIDNELVNLDVDALYNFFNPKAGLTYALNDRQQFYISYAIANREPVRSDFLDFEGGMPRAERLRNLEAGYRSQGESSSLNINFYQMDYTDQLVLTGELNDVGAFVRTNAGKSYRMGLELQGGINITDQVSWNANLTLSRNKIRQYIEVLENYGDDFAQYEIVRSIYRDTDIAFSPSIIGGSTLSYRPGAAELTLLSKYVGRQYLDNTQNDARSIEPYLLNDLRLTYTLKAAAPQVQLSLLVNNLFDAAYESNGFTYGYLAGSNVYRENFYFPQAGRNYMAMLAIKF